MKPFSEMTIEERLVAKRARCVGDKVVILRWDDEQEKDVIDGEGTIVDITRIEAPEALKLWLSSNGDCMIYGYVVEYADGRRQTYRISSLRWQKRK